MTEPAPPPRRRDLTAYPSPGPYNSLWHWTMRLNPLRVGYNYVLMALARVSPSLKLKRGLYRLMGARVGRHAAVGLEVTFDIFYPELIEIGDNSIVGFSSTLLCHEYLVKEYRTGPIRIGRDVTIGANTTILPGVTIGDGATVSAMSLVNRDIPPGEFWGGVPVRRLRGAATEPATATEPRNL
ncbi:MAG TPA: acyltransferase [Candidatus Thermoplasmatota archaeon]|nr:acyltransferase [Candidatus Thermoplasmatota archaeon]